MSEQTLAGDGGPLRGGARLFSTPSGTRLRFATLIGLALGTTALVHTNFAGLMLHRQGTSDPSARCQVRSGLYLLRDGWSDPDEGKWQTYWGCMRHQTVPVLTWVLVAVLLLLLLAAVLHRVQPTWRVRRRRLAPLDLNADAALAEELAALVRRAELTDPPTFLTDPLGHRTGGVAFGHRRRRLVCLDAGLLALRGRDPEAFRAVVLHELAHLRNRDVTVTHATLAVWRAFLVVTLVPFALTIVDPMLVTATPLTLPRWSHYTLAFNANTAWRIVALVMLVYASRASVLRARELYADARVALWTGTADPYRGFTDQARPRFWRWHTWWANHPGRAARTAALQRPHSLLRPGVGEMLAAGIAVQITWNHLWQTLVTAGVANAENSWHMVLRIAWSSAVAALLGVSGLRYAEFRRAGGRARGAAALSGLALGLGLVAGRFLDVAAAGRERSLPVTWIGAADALLLLGCATAVSCWAGYLAGLLGSRRRSRHGLLAAAALLLLCYVLLGRWTEEDGADGVLRYLLAPESAQLRRYAAEVGWTTWDSGAVHAVVFAFIEDSDRVLMVAALAALWLVPLLLGGIPMPRVRAALLAGLGAGAAWAVLDVALRAAAHRSVAAGVRAGDAFAVVFSSWEIVGIAAVQLVLSVLLARRRFGLPSTLLACTVTGAVGAAGLVGLHLADGCGLVGALARTTCTRTMDDALAARPLQVVPILGTVAALVGAALGGGLRLLRERTEGLAAVPDHRVAAGGRTVRVVAVAIVAACVASVAFPPAATRDVLKVDEAGRSAPPPNRGEAVRAIWYVGGGWDRILGVQRRMGWMFEAFQPFDPAMAQDRCTQLASSVRDARAFPAPPEATSAEAWTGLLDSVERGAELCAKAADPFDDSLMSESARSFKAANARMAELVAMVPR
ncbi:hypothetical protein GCM10010193_14810 [Kitasatospora atroaurantiaca]|uniref:Peptidase M48 domain-containing protein n=1 Tax=Kitasatospora atroaurantiaca TaxID=285545 RepID=A0A561EIC4_9ACTN|nr:M48 family metalloprotease [Kitasatospora atroaurantiaca]TWE15369.1 hypothetical protein FB465_0262 [Kitasatospora atroaurantiaca]